MKINLDVLSKSYDVRWIYGSEINEELFYQVWYLIWLEYLWWKVVVWWDSRISTDSLKDSIISWLIDSWVDVDDVWYCSTDMISFACWYYEYDIWIMVTASHNPKEYNWLKISQKHAFPLNMKEYWKILKKKIESWFVNAKFTDQKWIIKKINIKKEWINYVLWFIDTSKIKKFKVWVDAWNWVAWIIMDEYAKIIWIEISPLYFELDWNFPNHHPNPLEYNNLKDIIAEVKSKNLDLWVAFDWDADRMCVCDKNWNIYEWSSMVAILAEYILSKNPKCKIVKNTVTGRIVDDIVKENYWKLKVSKVWHVYIKELMNSDETIFFSWEHSWHYYFKDNWNADSWIIAFTIFLYLLSISWLDSEQFRNKYKKYYSIQETNFKIFDFKKFVEFFKKEYWVESTFDDGLLYSMDNYWINIRPSSNEPLVRLNIEANSEKVLDEVFNDVTNIIWKYISFESSILWKNL